MKRLALRKGAVVLYTGSHRIFAIRCYLEQQYQTWHPYLKQAAYTRDARDLPSSFWDRIATILKHYRHQPEASEIGQAAWGAQVVFVALVKELATLGRTELAVSALLQEYFHRTTWLPGSSELLRYAEGVESGLVPLTGEFYSNMRQPIQFFGTLTTAQLYSKYVYRYQIQESLQLVDISDRATCRELLATVFDDWTPFGREDLEYYCGPRENITTVRFNVLFWLFRRFHDHERLFLLLGKYYGYRQLAEEDPLIADLAYNWLTYYQCELCSPRGLWIASQVSILEGYGTRRFDMYLSDTLLVKVFTTGTGLDGWYCSNPQEWMIYHPERYGFLLPYQRYDFTGPECDFAV
jgi:hypothetical protein